MKYSYLVLGGTFDLLHLGHQSFLNKAFQAGKFVTIGLTTDKFNTSRGKPSFEDQNLRFNNLKRFLIKQKYLKRSKIILIDDIYGTTLKDPALKAIVVTSKTKGVVDLINQKRVAKNLNKLDIITVPFMKDRAGQIISSTRIRQGEINTFGQSYKSLLLKIAGKKLSEAVRKKLKKPLGQLTAVSSLTSPTITIGDITTANFIKAGSPPNLVIIDGKVGRKSVPFNHPEFISGSKIPKPAESEARQRRQVRDDRRVKNPPGQISKALILVIDQTLNKLFTFHFSLCTILVDGEEDLATIPAILLSPLGTSVFYGQPKIGMVEVKVDLEVKDYLCKILNLY